MNANAKECIVISNTFKSCEAHYMLHPNSIHFVRKFSTSQVSKQLLPGIQHKRKENTLNLKKKLIVRGTRFWVEWNNWEMTLIWQRWSASLQKISKLSSEDFMLSKIFICARFEFSNGLPVDIIGTEYHFHFFSLLVNYESWWNIRQNNRPAR